MLNITQNNLYTTCLRPMNLILLTSSLISSQLHSLSPKYDR